MMKEHGLALGVKDLVPRARVQGTGGDNYCKSRGKFRILVLWWQVSTTKYNNTWCPGVQDSLASGQASHTGLLVILVHSIQTVLQWVIV